MIMTLRRRGARMQARAEPAWESAASRPDSPSRVWVPSGPSSGYHKHVLEAERESGEGHAAEFHARPETAAAIRRCVGVLLHSFLRSSWRR